MVEGRFVGLHTRTGALLMMTKHGVLRGRSFNRMTLEDRWNRSDIGDLKGIPWNVADKNTVTDKPMLAGSDVARVPIQVVPQRTEVRVREFYVLKRDVERYGFTDGCIACTNIFLHGGALGTTHTKACKERIM